jgi:hypothetical protein
MGRTAYFATCLGITDYTIIDIPMSLVGQALYLASTIGPERIWLYGEPPKADRIRLLPPSFIEIASDSFDAVLNVDSLTYVAFARDHSPLLLSINHDANAFRVRELATPTYRFPYWLRMGYVEELFVFAPGS